jgi:type II secretory pathway pseudopilin PulG
MFDAKKTADDGIAPVRRDRAKRHDLGSAMLVVMGAATVLFVIAASVIGVVVFQQTQQVRAQAVGRATALSQQGMEVYLNALRTDPDYWVTTPTIAGVGQDGTWTVAANIASSTITAVGCERVSGLMHVIRASVRPETYADYTVTIGTADITLGREGHGVTINGTVRSNSTVTLAQDFPGVTVYSASGDVINPDNAGGGVKAVEPLDFSQIESVFPNLYTASWQRDTARATGAALPQEGLDPAAAPPRSQLLGIAGRSRALHQRDRPRRRGHRLRQPEAHGARDRRVLRALPLVAEQHLRDPHRGSEGHDHASGVRRVRASGPDVEHARVG